MLVFFFVATIGSFIYQLCYKKKRLKQVRKLERKEVCFAEKKILFLHTVVPPPPFLLLFLFLFLLLLW